MSVGNEQENKTDNEADAARGGTGDGPIALLLVCPFIYGFAYIKPVLATGAGAGSKTGSGATARSSTQPPLALAKHWVIQNPHVYTEEAKFSF